MRSARRRSVTSWYVTTIAPMAGSARRFTATASRSRQDPFLWRGGTPPRRGPPPRPAAPPPGTPAAAAGRGGGQPQPPRPRPSLFPPPPPPPAPPVGVESRGPRPPRG